MAIADQIQISAIKVCAQCGQNGRNADKIPRHTSKVNYVRMVLHSALALHYTIILVYIYVDVDEERVTEGMVQNVRGLLYLSSGQNILDFPDLMLVFIISTLGTRILMQMISIYI